jgi:hypothetical protein
MKYYLESCVFRWFLLYTRNYITIHGAKNIKFACPPLGYLVSLYSFRQFHVITSGYVVRAKVYLPLGHYRCILRYGVKAMFLLTRYVSSAYNM